MLGIYELNGDDLKIGFGNDGLIRPKRFELARDQVVGLLVLKRETKTIKRLVTFLIDAKTKGISEQTETTGPAITQITILEGAVARKVLLDSKDTPSGKEWLVRFDFCSASRLRRDQTKKADGVGHFCRCPTRSAYPSTSLPPDSGLPFV